MYCGEAASTVMPAYVPSSAPPSACSLPFVLPGTAAHVRACFYGPKSILVGGCACVCVSMCLPRSPYLGIAAWFEYLLFILFAIDLVLNFLVAYPDPAQQVLVTDPAMIRKHYLRYVTNTSCYSLHGSLHALTDTAMIRKHYLRYAHVAHARACCMAYTRVMHDPAMIR